MFPGDLEECPLILRLRERYSLILRRVSSLAWSTGLIEHLPDAKSGLFSILDGAPANTDEHSGGRENGYPKMGTRSPA
jgi:hypothetical protein